MENSKIEWTDHTFNPWIGCQHVSPGCDHCYAETKMPSGSGTVVLGASRAAEADFGSKLEKSGEMECDSSRV